MISEEVRMLNRDLPNLGPSKLPPKGNEVTVDPELGETGGSGRMGENLSSTREGPFSSGNVGVAPSSGRNVLESEWAKKPTGVRTRPEEDEDEDEDEGEDFDEELEEDEDDDDITPNQPDLVTQPTAPRLPLPGIPFTPQTHSLQSLTQSGLGTSTLATPSYPDALIADRASLVGSERFSRSIPRTLARWELVHRMVKGRSAKTEVLRRDRNGLSKGVKQEVDSRYHAVLEEVEKVLSRNGTYADEDVSRVFKEVMGRLPKPAAAAAAAKKKAAGAAVSSSPAAKAGGARQEARR
jgi:hypothetical protein